MKHIGFHIGPLGYKISRLPFLSEAALAAFDSLPEDPYYKERWRQFSQYILFYEHNDWASRVLLHRPFVQAKAYNRRVGGIARQFEPIRGVDPTPQFRAIANELHFDKDQVFQVNLHQWRTRAGCNYKGATVPEGAHRDGHHITTVTVWSRQNIIGGESLLYAIGQTEPFLEYLLQPGEILLLRDEDLVHGARDIQAVTPEGGHRDIWVISINPWSERRYGEDFEDFAAARDTVSTSS